MAYLTDGRLVPNFSLEEMTNATASEDIKLVLTPEVVEHAQMMQELRDWHGKPLSVNSWYRTESFNKKCGGASNSEHLDGRATDISNIPQSKYVDFTRAWNIICSLHKKIGNIQLYSWGMHFGSHADKFGWTEFRETDNR